MRKLLGMSGSIFYDLFDWDCIIAQWYYILGCRVLLEQGEIPEPLILSEILSILDRVRQDGAQGLREHKAHNGPNEGQNAQNGQGEEPAESSLNSSNNKIETVVMQSTLRPSSQWRILPNRRCKGRWWKPRSRQCERTQCPGLARSSGWAQRRTAGQCWRWCWRKSDPQWPRQRSGPLDLHNRFR